MREDGGAARRRTVLPTEAQLRTYEGMFLLDSAEAVKDWEATVGVVTGILERYGAEMALNGKWDERKLAYPIKKQKRGTYYLAYFNAPTDSIQKMRDDLLLREEVLRFLILAMPEDTPIPDTLERTSAIEHDDDDRRGGGRGRRRDDRQSTETPRPEAATAEPASAGEGAAAPEGAANDGGQN
jgi:small subunit ribosomal protein S6